MTNEPSMKVKIAFCDCDMTPFSQTKKWKINENEYNIQQKYLSWRWNFIFGLLFFMVVYFVFYAGCNENFRAFIQSTRFCAVLLKQINLCIKVEFVYFKGKKEP